MTGNSDLKKIVRARMQRTGESYTAARAAVLASPPTTRTTTGTPIDPTARARARAEQQRVVDRLFVEGRLLRVPAKRRTRVAVLLELLARFEPGRDYSEVEVNDLLRPAHDDVAYLRRELVTYRYLVRSGGVYRLPSAVPPRSATEAQEVPDWEAEWLPGHLAGPPVGTE